MNLSAVKPPSEVLAKILEIIAENSCIIRDSELYKRLKKEVDINYSDLLRYLMLLEIRGYVHVSGGREDVRIVSLSKLAKEQLRINSC